MPISLSFPIKDEVNLSKLVWQVKIGEELTVLETKQNVMIFQSHNWWDFQGAKRGPPWSIQVLSMIIMDGP